MKQKVDVVVVGGGIAGLTCAVGLRDSGLSVVLLEQSDSLGGRASSWIDDETGDPVHIGPHIFLSEYPNMLRLLDVLGTRDKVVWQRGKFITIYDGPKPIVMQMAQLPAPFHLVPSVIRDSTLPHRDKLSAVPTTIFALQLSEEDILRLDNISAASLLRSLGVSERHLERFWAFTSMSIMNVPVELCSAGALMRFYAKMVGHTGYDIGFPDGGLGDVFVPAARALLERSGVEVRTSAAVERFDGDRERATGVLLADGSRIAARHCVAAVPPQALRRVARPEWIAAHRTFQDLVAFQPCPYVSVFLWFDRKLTDQQFWARVHDPNDLNCDFYDLSNIHTGWRDRPSVIACNTIYSHRADGMSDAEIVARTVEELAEAMPEARRAKVVHSVVNHIPMAIHCPYPGTEQKRPAVRSEVCGLWLAGDWIRTELPSSMESAAMAGWRAAEQILAEEGKPRSLVVPHKQTTGFAGALRRMARVVPLHRVPMWMHGV